MGHILALQALEQRDGQQKQILRKHRQQLPVHQLRVRAVRQVERAAS